jgi:hypothetical protein
MAVHWLSSSMKRASCPTRTAVFTATQQDRL